MLVSIIIPYYNHGIFIRECLLSVLNSTHQNFEVILINDGSNNKNKKELNHIVSSLNDKRIKVFHQDNAGPCFAKNNGVDKAKGEFILFLDSDNYLLSHYLKDALDIFKFNSDVDLVYVDYEYFGGKSGVHISGELDEYKMLLGNPIDNCVMLKKSIFTMVGGFDTHLSKLGLEDWELWISLLKNNATFYYFNKVCFKYREVVSSRTQNVANKNLDRIKKYIYTKHGDLLAQKYELLFYQKKQLLETPDYRLGNWLMSPYRALKKIIRKI